MLNLSELVFKVNTEALVDAANKVAALGKSVDGLSSTFSKLEKSSSQASKAQAKAEKDLAAAEVDRAKAVDIAARTEERKSKAVRDTAKATEEATVATKSSVSILERQQTILEFQANGYSKGQASILAYAKAAGVAASEIQEIGKVLQAQRTLMGGDPFDKSLGSLKSLQNEFKTLKEVQRLYTAEIPLTRKQMENLALDKLRLIEAMKIEGRSMSDIKAAIKNLNIEYITTAQNINRVTQAENELDKARKDSASANAFLEKEMQRVNFALQAQNNELNKGTANALNRFEQNLKRSGLTLDQQRVKMEEYRKGLLALEKTKGGNTDYITRALGPQITDIFVGLATGQSPLTVMLQQGGQLRDQFALAGVAAADMGKTMRTAAKDMVVSVGAVAKAFGDLLLGAVIDTGKGITDLTMRMTGLNAVFEGARNRLLANGGLMGITPTSVRALDSFKNFVSFLAGGSLALGVGTMIALGVAMVQVIKENDKMAIQLGLTGAAMGLTFDSAQDMSKGMQNIGISTSDAMKVLSAMAKEGKFVSEEIRTVTKAAIDLNTYGGVAIEDTVKQFAKMKDKPVESLLELSRATGLVSAEVVKSVIELEDQGRTADATAKAIEELARVNDEQVERMKKSYNGFSLFMIDLGKGISKFFSDAFKDLFYASSPTEQLKKQLKAVDETLANWGTMNMDIAGVVQAMIPGEKERVQLQRTQLLNQIGLLDLEKQQYEAEQKSKQEKIAMLGLEKSVTDEIDKQNLKRSKKKDTLADFTSNFIEEKTKDAAKARNLDVATIRNNEELMESYRKLAKVEWDSASKKKSGNQTARATLDIDRSNEIRLLEQQFERGASLRQKFMDDQMKVMKADYEMGYITKAEYLDKETALLRSTLAQQRADSEAVIKQREALYLQETQTLINAYNERVKANKGLKNSDEADARALEKLQVALMNSGREYENFIDKVKSKDSALASSLTAKEVEAMKVLYENVKKNNEAYAEYIRNNELRIQQRKEDIATADALRWATPEQAAVIKAVADEVKHYGAELSKFQRIAKEAKETMDDTIGRFGVMSPQAQVAIKQYNTAMDRVNQVIADERVAKEQAATDAILEYYKNEYKRISDGITDSIVTALFEGGKAGSKKLRDVLVSVLRQKVTMEVDVGVNAFMNSLIGGAGGAGGGNSIMGGIQTASNLNSLYGAGAQALWGGTAGASAASLGYANIVGMAGGDAIGALAAANGMWSGVATGAQAAAQAAIAANTAMAAGEGVALAAGTNAAAAGAGAGAASSFGSALASIPGWGWAIAGIAALAGLMSKKATPHAGAGSTFSAASGLQNINLGAANNMGFMANYAKETQGFTDQITKTLVTALDSTAKSFGTTAGYAVSTAFADDTSKDGAWGQLIIQKLGKDLVNWGLDGAVGKWAPKEFGDGAEGQQQYMNAIAKSARDALKGAIGDVRWAQTMLDALGDNPTIEQLSSTVEQINQAQTAIGELGKNIQGFASLTTDAVSSLVEASGGAQAFFTNMQSFYDNFYSEAEKTANQTRDIAAALSVVGLKLPATREEYRKLVEQQLALGDSGAKAAAALLQYSGAFASITQSQEDLAQAEQDRIESAITAYKQQRRDILNAQIDTVNEQVNVFQRLFDFLDSEVKKLYGAVTQTASMQLSQAQAVITGAVSSRILPDQATLEDAVGTITGSMASTNYASKVDADRDKLRFAAQLDDLRNLAGDNLKSAKNTFDLLKLQLAALDDQTYYTKLQLNQMYTLDSSVQSVEDAIRGMSLDIQKSIYAGFSPGSRPTGSTNGASGSSGGIGSSGGRRYQSITPKVSYSSDEALTSFDKFNDWYKGLTYNASFSKDYAKPDWMSQMGLATTDDNLFKAYLFFKNNPQYAQDYEKITQGSTSGLSTNGSSLIRSDLSKMPADVADFFSKNPSSLLALEGFGFDPILAYKAYTEGNGAYVPDFNNKNTTEWLRTHKWTPSGVVDFNNPEFWANTPYKGTTAVRWDTQTGTLVDVDGSIYTPEGKKVGSASREQMIALYGADFVAQQGLNTQSVLYQNNIGSGMSAADYYSTLRTNLDNAISSGWSAQQLVDAMNQTGASLQDVANAYGVSPAEIARNLAAGGATGIPAFARGGKYEGGSALVGENGPELINFNSGGYIHTARESRNMLDQSGVINELARLNSKVEMLEAAARSTAISNNKIAKLLDRITPDGDALQVKTVAGSVTTTV